MEANGQYQSGNAFCWRNQDVEKWQPVLNLKLCVAVLFPGYNLTVHLRILSVMEVQVVSEQTFSHTQRIHLWPAIGEVNKAARDFFFKEMHSLNSSFSGLSR